MKKIISKTLLILLTVFSFASCRHEGVYYPDISKTFVLVHGSWQAPWVWNKVESQLIKAGQKVIVIELPAHGDDSTLPINTSLDIYRDKVIAAVNNTKGKVILVGHSLGGMITSEVAEKIPAKIERLVYIGAYIPANGQSLLDLANTDKQSLLGPALVPSADKLTLDVQKDVLISIFCEDAPENVKKEMLERYRAEPVIPFTNKAVVTDQNFGRIQKFYLHTLQDHAVGLDLQKQMAEAAHVIKTFSLNTSHSPFLSQPDEVVKILLTIASLK
ncbi:alpha/beta fold hydrolase [Flavitalea sp.]|nr:alpha/beta fold hydrolase [Flavitalea sp.]